MHPAEVAAGMATANRQLLANHALAEVDLDPGADGVDVAAALAQAQLQPVAHRQRLVGRAGTDVAPQLGLVPAVDDDHVQQAVAVQVNQHAAAAAPNAGDAGLLPDLDKAAVGLLQQQVVRVQHREVGHGRHIALDDEQVHQAVVVHVLELRMPGGRRVHVSAHIGPVRGDAALVGGVDIARSRCTGLQLLQLVVRHAAQKHLGQAVAVEVVAGNPHAPDLQRLPALSRRVLLRRLAGCELPQLLLTALVVLAVVADAQGRLATAVPVREQHRQRAVAGHQRQRRRIGRARRIRPPQAARRAAAPRKFGLAAVDISAEGQRRHRLAALPGGRERAVPGVAGAQLPALVGALELAVSQAAKQLHLADAQHHQVGLAVAVDVDRVGADGVGQLQARALFNQLDSPAAHAAVAVELGLVDARRDVDLGQAVTVAVEGRHPAADHVFTLAFEAALQAGAVGFFDEVGDGRQGLGRSHRGQQARCEGGTTQRHAHLR